MPRSWEFTHKWRSLMMHRTVWRCGIWQIPTHFIWSFWRKCHSLCLTSSKKFMLPWVLDKLPFKVSWVKKWIIGQKMHTLRQMSWLQNYAGNVHVEETFWYAKWNTAWLARLKSLSFQQIIFFLQKSHEDFFKKWGYI